MLRLPQAVLSAMPRGPLARDAQAAYDLITDPARAAMVIVTLAEELPVRETIELARNARETLKIPLGPVVVNAVPRGDLSTPSMDAVIDRLPVPTGDRDLDATLTMAARLRAHRRTADDMLARLKANPGLPMVVLPRVPTADLGPEDVELLAGLIR
jgi:hypothetical protein